MKWLWIILGLLSGVGTNSCQAQDITFHYTYGGNQYDDGFAVIEAASGYYVFGNTSSFGAGNTDILMIRVDTLGNPLWFKTYGSQNVENGFAALRTLKGTLLVAGYTNDTPGMDYNVYLLEVDTMGNVIREKKPGGASWDFGYSLVQTYDSAVYVAGETYSYGHAMSNAMLMKIDPNTLDTLWVKAYGGDSTDVFRAMMFAAHDSTLLMAGESNSYDVMGLDMFVVKTELSGDTLWTRRYADTLNDGALCITPAKGKDFFVGGYTVWAPDNMEDEYAFQCDSAGNPRWVMNFHCSSRQLVKSALQIQNDQFAINIFNECVGLGQGDVNFIFFHNNGFFTTGGTFGGVKKDIAQTFIQTRDKGFAIVGSTLSFGNTLPAIYLIKTDSLRDAPLSAINITLNHVQDMSSAGNNLMLYPVPAGEILQIEITSSSALDQIQLRLTDLTGRIVWSEATSAGGLLQWHHAINLSTISGGTYLFTAEWDGKTENRLVILKGHK